MTYECKFCKATLASEYSLLKHQKTVKKCLIKQGINFKDEFKCVICNQIFTLKKCLNTHNIYCSKKNILDIETKYNILETKYNILLEERKEWKIEQKELLNKITTVDHGA